MGRTFESLEAAVRAVHRAATIDEVPARLVGVLGDDHAATLSQVVAVTPFSTVRVVALWSAFDTVLDIGTEVSFNFTDESMALAETLLRGRPIALHTGSVDLGLLTNVLRDESIHAAIVAPLHEGKQVKAMISVAGPSPEALRSEDLPFFTGLARGIEEHVMKLIRASGRAD